MVSPSNGISPNTTSHMCARPSTGIDIEWTRKHLVAGEGKGATLAGTKGEAGIAKARCEQWGTHGGQDC